MSTWNIIKSKFFDMAVEEKRDYYRCGANFKTLSDIVDWGTYAKSDEGKKRMSHSVASKHTPNKNISMETATTDKGKANTTVTNEDQSKKDVVREKTTADESKAEQSVTGEDIPKTEITLIVEGSTDPPVTVEDIHKSVELSTPNSTESPNTEDIADPSVEVELSTPNSTETPNTEDIADPSVKLELSETGENITKKDDLLSENPHTDKDMADPPVAQLDFSKNDVLNGKISLFIGDITSLEIDAIVNAANDALECGGGVDFAIHVAAGYQFLNAECWDLDGCDTGDAKITGGYKLPAKYIIHAVGPKGEHPELLRSCYKKSMDLLKEHKLETIAFPCISTGIYGYPNENAAAVALETIRKWLDEDEYSSNVKRVIFCLFLDVDKKIYHKLLPKYFPF